LAAAVALLVAALGYVQYGSDAIFSSAGTRHSLPAQIPAAAGLRVYRQIDRIAPAPYVHMMIARAEFDRGDVAAAQNEAFRLPPSSARADLLGRIARARGDHALAQRYFIAADDVFAIGDEVDDLAKRDPARAYRVQDLFVQRLQRTATHPDALAEAYWRLGVLASKTARPALAMQHYLQAVSLSPLSAKYLIAAGFQSYDLHEYAPARTYFVRAVAVDPASADAYAGAGMAEFKLGNRAAAQRYAERSRSYDPHSHPLATLDNLLK